MINKNLEGSSINDIAERELIERCKIIISLTKECIENPTKANESLNRWAYHEIWRLISFPKVLASVEAYNRFRELTGKDIRNYNWDTAGNVIPIIGKSLNARKLFTHEHMIPSSMIYLTLIREYKKGNLSVNKVKEIISKQRVCWITKEEDSRLTTNGNQSKRPDPIKAYKNANIEILEENMEDLKEMFNSLKLDNLSNNIISNRTTKNTSNKTVKSESEFSKQLREYFSKKYPTIKYQYWKNNYPCVYYQSGYLINVRLTRDGLHLNDINLYIEGDQKAREKFDKIKLHKDKIENYLGYKLVWQRYGIRKEKSTTCRIGRFGKYSTDENMYNNDTTTYNFDLDVKQVAEELVKFYNVFVLDKLNIFKA